MKAEKIIYCLLKIHLDFIHDDVKVFPFYGVNTSTILIVQR